MEMTEANGEGGGGLGAETMVIIHPLNRVD